MVLTCFPTDYLFVAKEKLVIILCSTLVLIKMSTSEKRMDLCASNCDAVRIIAFTAFHQECII